MAEPMVSKRLFGVQEAADLLGIKRSKLYDLTKERKVPFRRIGKSGIQFTQDDITSIIDNALIPAVTR